MRLVLLYRPSENTAKQGQAGTVEQKLWTHKSEHAMTREQCRCFHSCLNGGWATLYEQVVSENAHLGLLPYRPPVYTNVPTGLFFESPEHAHYFGFHIALHICFEYEQTHGIRDAA